ncbi:MAG: iron-containing alcohol dehydrogenase [Treponema sp.]|nr:iron-containing alcohol dehydrogenase [Treponema sp.]
MSDFIFRMSPNIILGSYSLSRLGQMALEYGTRYLVIMDPILSDLNLAEKVSTSLDERKIECIKYGELTEGSSTKTIERALSLAREGHVHGVIAVGGKKALNIGRAVAAFYNEIHDLYSFVDGATPNTTPLPCICVPSTYTYPFVFTNEIPVKDARSNRQVILKVQSNICRLCLVDPNMMLTFTKNQKMAISLETIAMAMEAYLSQKATFFSDMFVEKAMQLMSYGMDGSPTLEVTTPEEVLLTQAGCMASVAAASSSLGVGSLLSLTINARNRLSKPLVSSILLPYTIEDAMKYKVDRLDKLAHILRYADEDTHGEDAAQAFAENVRQRLAQENMPARLKDLQLTMEQLALCAEDAGQIEIVNKLPRSMTSDDLFEIIKTAY